ncbi:lamin tail domain-containing protein [Natrinema marinum]|uniref:lamin tail domain-containing protein n=1 Tax=Natrinema marinum TaxID=2961598 RepID=UPI0020C892F9|nr:lamin tail domain-containing protein [Natrinema marinum]
MTDRTTWTRLEPRPRAEDMRDGLRAEIRDPLWLLSRQWQVKEFAGEDAGSPIRADVTVAEDALERVDLRGGGRSEVGPFDYHGGPLEALVERERVMTDDDPTVEARVEAGSHFLRTLRAHGYTNGSNSWVAADFPDYLLSPTDEPMETADRRFVELLTDRAIDGRAIYDALANGESPLPVGGSRTAAFDDAVADYQEWYESLYDEPDTDTGSAWDPTRLEYRFAVSTGTGDNETVLEAPEYQGGSLEWYAFSTAEDDEATLAATDSSTAADALLDAKDRVPAATASKTTDRFETNTTVDGTSDGANQQADPTQPSETATEAPAGETTSAVPTQVSFPGMPAARWWEFEEGDVNFGELAGDGAALSRLLLTEFAAQYGNDWFELSLETPIGTLSRLTELTVTDTFGVTETAEAAIDDDWNLFMHDLGDGDAGLFVPPTLAESVTSDPVERVVFGRDETANAVFAIERLVEGPVGRPVDRTEFRVPKLVVDAVAPAATADEEFVRLANPGEDRLDLSGLRLVAEGDDETTTLISFGDHAIPAGGTLTVYTGNAPTDETPPDADATLEAALSDPALETAESIAVYDGDDVLVRQLRSSPAEEIDEYRLSTDVADYWYPFTMARLDDAYRLERSVLLDANTLGVPVEHLPWPRGEVLDPPTDLLPPGETNLLLYETAVPRSGREVTRHYQFARWTDGAAHLWSTRESGIGKSELSSGLAFDVLEDGE